MPWMRRWRIATAASLALTGTVASSAQNTTDDASHVKVSSTQFEQSTASALQTLRARGFPDLLATPSVGSVEPATLQMMTAKVKRGATMPDVSVGTPGATYDIVLQPGHYGRRSGATGTGGALISEQQIVAYVVGVAATRLRRSGLKVLVVPADNVVAGLRTKAFLAVHADGSPNPCSTGPSLAYPQGLSPFPMHAIGLAVSRALGYRYDEFRKDGFTANEAHYYMFRKINGSQLTGLLEIGELTCPDSEQRVIAGADRLGVNVAQALAFTVSLAQ